MKHGAIFVGIVLSITYAIFSSAQQGDFPALKGPYLGQKPPGMTPEVFAPGLISTDKIEFGNAFSPDGGEFYFTRFIGEKKTAAILSMKMTDNRWGKLQIAPFSGEYSDVDPIFFGDGKKLCYSSNRPLGSDREPKSDYDIWIVSRTESGWSEPVNPEFPLNSEKDEFSPSVTEDGTIYFASNREGGLGHVDFYCSRLIDGKYGKPENLGEAINTKYREGDGFISPDEGFFLFSAFVPGNNGVGDLYISFRGKDGKWIKASNLGGEINTSGNEFTPVITADGKYLFFASDRTGNDDIYWVDMGVVKKAAQDRFIDKRSAFKKRTSCANPRLFIIGGLKERELYPDVYSISILDLASGKNAAWDRGPSLPKALQGHTAVAAHDHIYVLGGLEGFGADRRAIYSSDVFSAEIGGSQLSEWKRTKPLPHPLGYHAAVTYKDLIIISGGQSPTDNSAVYIAAITANGETSDWEAAGDLPKPARGHASVIVQDRLFILGGHNDKGFFDDVFSAPVGRDGKLGRWERATPLPLPIVHFGLAERNGRIYIFGGQDAEDNLHTEVYSSVITGSKLGNWRKETPFPVPQSRMTVHIMDERVIVTGGGFGWEPPVYSAVYASDMAEDGRLGKWRKIGDLPGQLAFHAAVICPERRKP